MATGATSTYALTNGIKLDVEDLIQLISPTDIPLQGSAMGATDAIGLPTGTVFEKMYQWLDETILTPRTTIQTSTTTADSFIVVASGDRQKFQTGDIILVGSEYMRVTGYGSTTDSITVTRTVSGAAATVATSADVVGVGSLLAEGSDPPNARFLDRNTRTNVTEIFGPVKVQSTFSDLAIQKYGITNEFDHQVANRIKELAIAVDQACTYGVKIEDLTNQWRSFNGMSSFITSVTDTTTTTLTQASINTMAQTVYGNGGTPDIIMVGAKQKGVISTFTSSGTVFVTRGDAVAGRVVSTIDTDFATFQVCLNRWVRKSELFMFNRDQGEICTLRPMQYQTLAQTGDAQNGMVVAEKGFKWYRQAHSGLFNALT